MRTVTSEQVLRELDRTASLEGRTRGEQAMYLLDVMLSAIKQLPHMRLTPEPSEGRTGEEFSIFISPEMYDILFHAASRYGMKSLMFYRALLWNGLALRKKLVPESRLLSKEVFVSLILESFSTPVIQ